VKRKFLTIPGLELDPSVVQPVARRYTDYAIPPPVDPHIDCISTGFVFLPDLWAEHEDKLG
jgi:hypothetical protein